MFRRLRTKLIVASSLLSLATVIPMALLPYMRMQSDIRESNNKSLLKAKQNLSVYLNDCRNVLSTNLPSIKDQIEMRLASGQWDPQDFLLDNHDKLDQLQSELTSYNRTIRPNVGLNIVLNSNSEYARLCDDLAKNPQFAGGLLPLKNVKQRGYLAAWDHEPIVFKNNVIGGVLVAEPLFVPESEDPFGASENSSNLDDEVSSKGPALYNPIWPGNMIGDVEVHVIGMTNERFLNTLEQNPELKQEISVPKGRIFENVEIQNRMSQALFIPIPDYRGNVVGVVIFARAQFKPLQEFIEQYLLLAIVLSIGLAVLLAIIVARSIAAPINNLARTAKKMAGGDLTARVEVIGSDEIGTLSQAFNDMAATVESSHSELKKRARDLQESNELLESANHELQRTHEFLENLLANIRTGVIALDMDGRVVRINRAAVEILSNEGQGEGKHFQDLIGRGTFAQLVDSTLHKGISIFQREVQHTTNFGQSLPLQVSTVPLLDEGQLNGMVVTFHDLSNIRRLEEQLVRQDRLAALGRLSAGVAHEIRNPLGIMKGSAELLKRRFGGKPGEEGLTDFILDEIARLSRVVNDFLNFARPPAPELQRRDVNEIVRRATAFLGHQETPAPINYNFELAPDLPPVALDSNLFQQVLLNLLLNAQEAMPEGGNITIRTALTPSAEVAIEIVDEGIGIARESLDRIFDPFFTSKDTGSGLGLSVVHQVVIGHGGRIEVESEPSVGSTFRVILPVFIEPMPESMAAAS